MKNFTFLILIVLQVFTLGAQNIIIDFKPEDPNAVIDSVQATNLSTGQSVMIAKGGKLTLFTTTTGAVDLPMVDGKAQVYPNPCEGEASISFAIDKREKVTIRIVNAMGQQVSALARKLEPGRHHFFVQLPRPGLYLVSVQKSGETLDLKLLSKGKTLQNALIRYGYTDGLEAKENPITLKSAAAGNSLNYELGNVILYTFYSGKNKTVVSDKPTAPKTLSPGFYPCVDKAGKSYAAVKIGEQVWMAENLAYLPSTTPTSSWSNTEPYYYVYDYNKYGVLYNYPAALTASPAGWHLPSDAEWTTLADFLTSNGYGFGGSGNKIAKALASSIGWNNDLSMAGSPGIDLGSNNISGFSALPGGDGVCFMGCSLNHVGYQGWWWTSTIGGEGSGGWKWAYCRSLRCNNVFLDSSGNYVYNGLSVRCIKD